jgi:hypothetical protein
MASPVEYSSSYTLIKARAKKSSLSLPTIFSSLSKTSIIKGGKSY